MRQTVVLVGSCRSNDPLDPTVEHRLVPGRELLGGDHVVAAPPPSRPPENRSPVGGGFGAERRVLMGRPRGDGRMGGRSESTNALACSTACPRTAPDMAPLQREVADSRMPSSSAAAYVARCATCPWTRTTSRPRSTADSMSSRIIVGRASAKLLLVGSMFAPLRNSRSPLTEQTQSSQLTWRSPVRRWRRSLSSSSTNTSTVTW